MFYAKGEDGGYCPEAFKNERMFAAIIEIDLISFLECRFLATKKCPVEKQGISSIVLIRLCLVPNTSLATVTGGGYNEKADKGKRAGSSCTGPAGSRAILASLRLCQRPQPCSSCLSLFLPNLSASSGSRVAAAPTRGIGCLLPKNIVGMVGKAQQDPHN
ncbi:MAG: hypothetical protein FWG10_10950 [Eubacteriaceae bacterium]|nr:hypothetical protein [Eubacteriaceae bacterium]